MGQGLLGISKGLLEPLLDQLQAGAFGENVGEVAGSRALLQERLGLLQVTPGLDRAWRLDLQADERVGVVEPGHVAAVLHLLHEDPGSRGELERVGPVLALRQDAAGVPVRSGLEIPGGTLRSRCQRAARRAFGSGHVAPFEIDRNQDGLELGGHRGVERPAARAGHEPLDHVGGVAQIPQRSVGLGEPGGRQGGLAVGEVSLHRLFVGVQRLLHLAQLAEGLAQHGHRLVRQTRKAVLAGPLPDVSQRGLRLARVAGPEQFPCLFQPVSELLLDVLGHAGGQVTRAHPEPIGEEGDRVWGWISPAGLDLADEADRVLGLGQGCLGQPGPHAQVSQSLGNAHRAPNLSRKGQRLTDDLTGC